MGTTKAITAALALALTTLLAAPQAATADPAGRAEARRAEAPAARRPDFTPDARHFERYAQRIVDEARIPGLALAIVQDGRIITARGFGVADTRTGEAVTADTVFRLASLSKAFAGTLTAMLVREGAIGWDTRLAEQIPTFSLLDAEAAGQLTVRDVLAQRVGLNYNTFDRDLEAEQPYEVLAQRLAEAPLACAPGQCYTYQNIAFSLIGDLTFAATGDFYTHQVERRIFHPLGMLTATYGRDGLESSERWARPHISSGGRWIPVRPKETYYRVPPAAGVNASITDVALWLVAQMGDRPDVLPQELLDDVQAPQISTPGELRGSGWRRDRLRSASYASGWRVYDYAGERLVFHGGAVQGYRAVAGFLPEQGIGVAILWNSESAVPTGLMPSILDRALGLPERDWVQLDRIRRPGRRR